MIAGKKKRPTLVSEDIFAEEYYESLHALYESLNEAFKASGLTQDELAVRTKIDKSTISRILRGRRDITIKTGSRIAAAMQYRLLPLLRAYSDIGSANYFKPTPTHPARPAVNATGTVQQSSQANTTTVPANKLLQPA